MIVYKNFALKSLNTRVGVRPHAHPCIQEPFVNNEQTVLFVSQCIADC